MALRNEAEHKIAVHCRGIIKIYGSGDTRVMALRGVDLEVCLGELLMLVGPSGSGKTTLISIIAGILDPDGGACVVLDRNFQQMGTADRARFRGRSVGFVFQSFNLLPSITIAMNVAVPLLINGIPRKSADARARAILESVGLGARADALPAQLSGGQQQLVAIARALVHEPKLIVCDEPTSNLDHATGHKVMEILRRVAQSPDRALLVVTHDARIFGFADRIARMDDGKVIEIRKDAAGSQ
ncbi:ABC transporter ATP-binding protein [bacterium]|nr:MAG: ABC transporter ATP-binding protein [bacterium]